MLVLAEIRRGSGVAVFNWAIPLCAPLVILISVDIFSTPEKHMPLWIFVGKGQSMSKSDSEGSREPPVFTCDLAKRENLTCLNTEVMCKMLNSLLNANYIPWIDLVYTYYVENFCHPLKWSYQSYEVVLFIMLSLVTIYWFL